MGQSVSRLYRLFVTTSEAILGLFRHKNRPTKRRQWQKRDKSVTNCIKEGLISIRVALQSLTHSSLSDDTHHSCFMNDNPEPSPKRGLDLVLCEICHFYSASAASNSENLIIGDLGREKFRVLSFTLSKRQTHAFKFGFIFFQTANCHHHLDGKERKGVTERERGYDNPSNKASFP